MAPPVEDRFGAMHTPHPMNGRLTTVLRMWLVRLGRLALRRDCL